MSIEARQQLEDDPTKPWKAVLAALSALAASLLALGLDLPPWAVSVLTTVAAAGGAFAVKNPKRARRQRPPKGQRGQTSVLYVLAGAVLLVVLVLLLLRLL